MARRIGARADRSRKQDRWNRWRCLIRNPKFHSDLNRLRSEYKEWVGGPPLAVGLWNGEDVVDATLDRKEIDLHRQPIDHYEDPFLCAWEEFEHKWGIKLPAKGLG